MDREAAQDTATRPRGPAAGHLPGMAEDEREGRLRDLAIERIQRVRAFKLHAAVFAVAVPLLSLLWVLTEYYEEHTWPIFFGVGIWMLALVLHALRAYLGPPVGWIRGYIRRPIAEPDIERELERLRTKRQ